MLFELIESFNKNLFEIWYKEYYDSDNFEDYMEFPLEEFEDNFFEKFVIDYPEKNISDKFYNDLYNKELEDKMKSYARDWFDNRIEELESQLLDNADYYSDRSIYGYRVMGIEEPEDLVQQYKNKFYPSGYDGVGECFSFEESKAEAHNYEGGSHIVLECIIPFDSIDIESTFFLNMCLALGFNESEIRLKKGSNVILKRVYYKRENIELFNGELALQA